VCVRNAFARDRSSELIDEWDSIHLDGVSWHSSGTVEMVCRTQCVTVAKASDNLRLAELRGLMDISLLGNPRMHGGIVGTRMVSNVWVMSLTLAKILRGTCVDNDARAYRQESPHRLLWTVSLNLAAGRAIGELGKEDGGSMGKTIRP
jgi:hypothetical protein